MLNIISIAYFCVVIICNLFFVITDAQGIEKMISANNNLLITIKNENGKIGVERNAACWFELDSLFDNYFSWLAKLYDYESGGFYYAHSSLEDKVRFKPDIESTSQALSILKRSSLIGPMPKAMKRKLILFFQDRQDPITGFFFDPYNNMRNIERLRGRSLYYSIRALEILEAKPLYPFPTIQSSKKINPVLSHLETAKNFERWLQRLPWENSWSAIDRLESQRKNISLLAKDRQNEILRIVFTNLAERQNLETGLWGSGTLTNQISGAFKASSFYRTFKHEMPNVDKIYKRALYCLRTKKAEDFCFVRNPVNLIYNIRKSLSTPIPKAEIEEIVGISISRMRCFLKPDGGFSRKKEMSLIAPNGIPLGKGRVEGDLNAGVQALIVRDQLLRLANIQPHPLSQRIQFYEELGYQ